MSKALLRAAELRTSHRWLIFAALMTPYVFYSFCWNTENFLRPYIAESLGLSRTQVSAFYTAQALGALLGAIILSQVADRYSRRNTLVGIAAGFGCAAIATIWVHDYTGALLQRLLMGFFLGGTFGCTVGIYVGLFPPWQRGLLAGIVQLVYNGGDALLSWSGRLYGADSWRTVLQIGGAGALVAGLVVWLLVPEDGRLVGWGETSQRPAATGKWAILQLFSQGRASLTLRLVLLCGLNFFAFQAFSGWVTTYLREMHHFPPDTVGRVVTVLHVGSMLGALFWGLVADRYGRRFAAAGFALAALIIVAYIAAPGHPVALALIGFAYGFGLVCSGIWGPYFAELYPEELRASAASIFNWGRIFSLFGALVSGVIAERFGLKVIMSIGALTFLAAAWLWWTLPETLPRRPSLARSEAS